MPLTLIIPAFIAGLLTFLAPCTFPLVPGYLSFISGVKPDAQNPSDAATLRWKVFKNGVFYVIGFSAVFILLGALFGLGGAALSKYRYPLSQIGGIFVLFFGLYLTGVFQRFGWHFLDTEKRFSMVRSIVPGKPLSSFLFGATFAFGWTPCIGPVLASVLALAAATATVSQGIFLLSVFSLGLAVPFLLIALSYGSALIFIKALKPFLHGINMVGGILLIGLGFLLLTDNLVVWTGLFYDWTKFINYDRLFDYL